MNNPIPLSAFFCIWLEYFMLEKLKRGHDWAVGKERVQKNNARKNSMRCFDKILLSNKSRCFQYEFFYNLCNTIIHIAVSDKVSFFFNIVWSIPHSNT